MMEPNTTPSHPPQPPITTKKGLVKSYPELIWASFGVGAVWSRGGGSIGLYDLRAKELVLEAPAGQQSWAGSGLALGWPQHHRTERRGGAGREPGAAKELGSERGLYGPYQFVVPVWGFRTKNLANFHNKPERGSRNGGPGTVGF